MAWLEHPRLLSHFLTKGNSMAYTVNTSAAALNRAFNNANATPTAFAATAAALSADQIAAANTFDVATLTDLALSTQVLTNMGILPSTVTEVVALEAALADYFAGPGKGNRGFVVLQLAEILSGFAATDVFYGAAATAWNAEVAASEADATSVTVALTTATTDNVVGSSAGDIFNGVLSLLTSANTLNATDKIDGGAGADQLNLTIGTAFTGFTTGSVANVETISLTNAGETARDFDASGVTGATTYALDGTNAGFTLTDLSAGVATINLASQKSGALTTAFATGVTAPTAVALGLNTVGATSTVTATLGGYTEANVTVTGANKVTFAGSLTDIVMSGTGSATVGGVPTTLETFDASGVAGAVVVTTTAVTTANSLTSVKTGSGGDTITASGADLSVTATISGGAGTDSLAYDSSAARTVAYNMSGIETLTIGTVSGALIMSGRNTTDLANVSTTSTTAGTVTLVNQGASNLAFTSLNASSSSGDVSSDHTGSTTLTYTGLAANITAQTATAKAADYTFGSAAGALTVAVSTYVDTTGANITATKASSVTLTVASGLDTSATPVEITQFDSTITAPLATSISVTATGALGTAAIIDAATATTATVVNGTTAGTLELVTPKLESLTVTTSKALDLETTSDNLTGLQALTVNAIAGQVDFGDLVKANVVTLSGAGATSKVVLGNLGATTNDYNLTVTATDLGLGLTVGTLTVGAGYDTVVTADDLDGNLIIGVTTGGDDVTISANRVDGTVAIDAITTALTGDVVVQSDDAAGAVSVGAITGGNVTLDLSSSIAGATIGAITAKTSATVALSDLQANNTSTTDLVITAGLASTALTVAVTGGALADTVVVNGITTNTSITVTGDLGSGTDTLTVNGVLGTAAQAISISGSTNYDSSNITGGLGADTITGGAGVDRITAYRGADTLTGNGGYDTFVFNAGDSNHGTFDTIVDFSSGDEVEFGGAAIARVTTAVTGDADTAAVSTLSVATFTAATTSTTLANRVTLIADALGSTAGAAVFFQYGADTYLFINDGVSGITFDVVVKLTGVSIPTAYSTDVNSGSGLTGFGA